MRTYRAANRRRWIYFIGLLTGLPAAASVADEPISVHPENPRYFLFRGRPLVLITATEHYGSVVNRAFDFERYLADAADKQQTLTRLFLLFRELQNQRNPSSPIKPESPDFIAPWPRTGPGRAMDGEPKFDLDRWNPEYFERLDRFLTVASKLGIIVELTLFSNTYADGIWRLNPLRDQNNLQRVGAVDWQEYITLKNTELVERQMRYARKIIQATHRFDNIYYEICNEPGGGLKGHATPADVDAWQAEVNRVIRDELAKVGGKHLVFGQQAFSYTPKFTQPLDASFADPNLDAVNAHALPNTILGGKTYNMGNFMSKELELVAFRDFTRAAQRFAKPCVHDEDNCATLYRDDVGWTIHRKRAWTAVMCMAHYDFIDFSITVGSEAGTAESSRKIRTWMRHLSAFIHSFDFIHAEPASEWIETRPEHLVDTAMAKTGTDYIAYFADAREVTDPTAGRPIAGKVAFHLPEGTYRVCLYSPVTGMYSPCMTVRGGSDAVTIELPPFKHDMVLRVTRTP